MNYAESAYFDGNHCAHCAERAEFMRLRAKRRLALAAMDRRPKRSRFA